MISLILQTVPVNFQVLKRQINCIHKQNFKDLQGLRAAEQRLWYYHTQHGMDHSDRFHCAV